MSDPSSPSPVGQERRVWVRHPATPETPYFSVSEEDDIISWKARIRDISQGGISLLLRSTFAPDTVVDIVFPPSAGFKGRKLNAFVIRSEPQDDVTFLVGCRFVRSLGEAELKTLLDAAAEAEPEG